MPGTRPLQPRRRGLRAIRSWRVRQNLSFAIRPSSGRSRGGGGIGGTARTTSGGRSRARCGCGSAPSARWCGGWPRMWNGSKLHSSTRKARQHSFPDSLLARLMPIRSGYAAGARAARRTSRNGSGSFSSPDCPPARGKAQSDHSHSRTEASASEKVTTALPGHSTPTDRFDSGKAWYSNATTAYSPKRHGAARSTVRRHQPLVVSSPRWQRSSWNVVSMVQP